MLFLPLQGSMFYLLLPVWEARRLCAYSLNMEPTSGHKTLWVRNLAGQVNPILPSFTSFIQVLPCMYIYTHTKQLSYLS